MNSSDTPAPENQPTTPSPPDYSIEKELGLTVKICPGCHTSNLPTSEYCYKCGLKLLAEKDISQAVKICTGCHSSNQSTSKYCYKCGLALPDKVTLLSDISAMIPAGFWHRFASFVIDNIFILFASLILFSILFLILSFIFPDLSELYVVDDYTWETLQAISERQETWFVLVTYASWLVFGIAYWTISIGWKGQTLGKLMFGLKVVKTDGGRAGFIRAFGRSLGYILCILTIGIGFLEIVWNPQKRGLHDFICGTMVVKK